MNRKLTETLGRKYDEPELGRTLRLRLILAYLKERHLRAKEREAQSSRITVVSAKEK